MAYVRRNVASRPRVRPPGNYPTSVEFRTPASLENGIPYAMIFGLYARDIPDDPFSNFVDNIRVLARLANGIALEIGLTDGSVPADDVIIELLRLGTLKPEHFAELESKLKPPVATLENLISSLADSTGLVNAEQRLLDLEHLRVMSSKLRDLKNLAGMKSYLVELNNVEKIVIDPGKVKKLKTALELNNYLAFVNKWTESDFYKLEALRKELLNFEAAAKNFKSEISKIEKLKQFQSKSEFINQLVEESKAREAFDKVVIGQADEDDLIDNVKKYQNATELVKNSQSTLSDVNQLISARLRTVPTTLKHSIGLPNGVQDLQAFPAALDDNWLRKHGNINESISTNLKTAFRVLDRFDLELGGLETSLGGIADTDLNSAESVTQLLAQMAGSDDLTGKTNKVMKCYTANTLKAIPISDIATARTPIEKLNAKLDKLSTFAEVTRLEDLSKFTKEQVAKVILQAFKNMEGDVKAMIALLEEVHSQLELLQKLPTELQQLAQTIRTNFTKIERYHQSLIKSKFLELYSCLGDDVGADGVVVKDMIQGIRSLRGYGHNETMTSAETALDSIVKLSGGMTRARNSGQELKKVSVKEAMALKSAVPNAQDHAQKLGSAAQGLANIEKVLKVRRQLDKLPNDFGFIKDGKIKTEFASLKTSISQMFSQIDTYKSKLSTLNVTNLHSYTPMFEEAKKIESVRLDVLKMKEAVESLKDPSLQPQIDDTVTALNSLETLDLDFASYHIQDAVPSLTAFDQFPMEFAGELSKLTAGELSKLSSTIAPSLRSGECASVKELPYVSYDFLATAFMAIIVGALIILGLQSVFRKKIEIEFEPGNSNEHVFRAPEQMVKRLRFLIQNGKHPRAYGINLKKMIEKLAAGTQTTTDSMSQWRRESTHCHRGSSHVKLELHDFIHANFMRIGRQNYVMAQAPMDGSEGRHARSNVFKTSTIEPHYEMIEEKVVKRCVQLCNFEEGGQVKCSVYYPQELNQEQTWGVYKVKTVEIQTNLERFTVDRQHFSLYKLEVNNTNTNTKFAFEILRYFGWPDKSAPFSPIPGVEIVEYLEQDDETVLVHCSAGVGRTGTIVGIKKGVHMAFTSGLPMFEILVMEIVTHRSMAIHTCAEIFYLTLCVTTKLLKIRRGEEYYPLLDEITYYYQQILRGDVQTDENINYKSEKQRDYDIAARDLFVEMAKSEYEVRKKAFGGPRPELEPRVPKAIKTTNVKESTGTKGQSKENDENDSKVKKTDEGPKEKGPRQSKKNDEKDSKVKKTEKSKKTDEGPKEKGPRQSKKNDEKDSKVKKTEKSKKTDEGPKEKGPRQSKKNDEKDSKVKKTEKSKKTDEGQKEKGPRQSKKNDEKDSKVKKTEKSKKTDEGPTEKGPNMSTDKSKTAAGGKKKARKTKSTEKSKKSAAK
ncbi:unnamed protein product [Caenorhabditis sp. 36 PRJEB53466]|nr:unnamed protein product [Caenorhabditis sp. 36 PRJEB53466]